MSKRISDDTTLQFKIAGETTELEFLDYEWRLNEVK